MGPNEPIVAKKLLPCLFVHGLGVAPLAILFELDFALNQFFVFGAPIIDALALLAGEFYQTVL